MILAIETDSAGAESLADAARATGSTFDTREVQAQVGDPDTWMFVAQMLPTAATLLSGVFLTLMRQRKIKYIKVGETEFRDITPGPFEKVKKALESADD